MRARFRRPDLPDVDGNLPEMFAGVTGVEIQGTDHDGFYQLVSVEDDGRRVYDWAATSILEWIGSL